MTTPLAGIRQRLVELRKKGQLSPTALCTMEPLPDIMICPGYFSQFDYYAACDFAAALLAEVERLEGELNGRADERLIANYSTHIYYSFEDAAFVATCDELPGLSGVGNTRRAALDELLIAAVAALRAIIADGEPLPLQRVKHLPPLARRRAEGGA